MSFILEVVILSTIKDKLNEKLRPPLPPILMMKNGVFRLWRNLSLSRVNGWFYFSCYSVQDCSLLTKLIKVVSSLK